MNERVGHQKFIQLEPIRPNQRQGLVKAAAATGSFGRAVTGVRRHALFYGIVVLPTVLAAFYYFVLASNIYTSEARFVVRTSERTSWNILSSFLRSAGLARAADDSFVVNDFILSRDALRLLTDKHKIAEAFNRPEADIFSRFPSLFNGKGSEKLFKFYLSQVNVEYLATTGINSLTVSASRPDDAQVIAATLLDESEQLINRLNARAHSDAVQFAKQQLEMSQARALSAQKTLTDFRNRVVATDPERLAGVLGKMIADLASDAASSKVRLRELIAQSPDSPEITGLRSRITAIEGQITSEQHKLAGSGPSLVPILEEYDRLRLDLEFAQAALLSAQTSLEHANQSAQKKLLYLERVVDPGIPDYPSGPHAVLKTLFIALLSFCFFITLTVLRREVLAHDDD